MPTGGGILLAYSSRMQLLRVVTMPVVFLAFVAVSPSALAVDCSGPSVAPCDDTAAESSGVPAPNAASSVPSGGAPSAGTATSAVPQNDQWLERASPWQRDLGNCLRAGGTIANCGDGSP